MDEINKTGYLEVLVLSELETCNQTGYDLISIIGKKLGRKPSPGSIYPLLKKLLSKKLIDFKSQGSKKVYFLTTQGKKLLNSKLKEKETMITKHMDLFKLMIKAHIYKTHPELDNVNRVKVCEKISDETAKLLLDLKEAILESILSENTHKKNYASKEQKLNDAISKAIILIKKSNETDTKLSKEKLKITK